MSNSLKWEQTTNEDGSEIHEAESAWHDEGLPFYFRVRKEGDGTFTEQSDGELVKGQPRSWASLEQAKKAMQEDHEEILSSGGHW